MTRVKSVVVIQEYVPEYRRYFFEELGAQLRKDGLELSIVVGDTPPHGVARGEAVAGDRIVHVHTRRIAIGQRYLSFRNAGEVARTAELVIADQQLRQLETHWLLMRQRFGGPPIALWGHGGSYSGTPGRADRWLMRKMTNRAHWFFAYTEGGADAVVAGGFDASRVTVVGNASDTEELITWRKSISPRELESTRHRLNLEDDPVGLYVGALDESKEIRFLLDAAAEIARRIPTFKLLICGDGPLRDLVERQASNSEWLRYLGRVTGREKARVAACARVMLIPARIGLVAVDSLALGLPLVTAATSGHGPEFEFLEPDRTVIVAPGGREAFVSAVTDLLRDEARRLVSSHACSQAAANRTVGAMVRSFTGGIQQAMEESGRGSNR